MAIVYGVSVGIGSRVDGFREVSGSFQGDSKISAVRVLSLERKWVSMDFGGLLWVTMGYYDGKVGALKPLSLISLISLISLTSLISLISLFSLFSL